jgi:hypothetical protein
MGSAPCRRRVCTRGPLGRGEDGLHESDRRPTLYLAVREMPCASGAEIRDRAETRVWLGWRPRSAQGRDVETPQRCQRRHRSQDTRTGRMLRELRPRESSRGGSVRGGHHRSGRAFMGVWFKRTFLPIFHLFDLLVDLPDLAEVPSMFWEIARFLIKDNDATLLL